MGCGTSRHIKQQREITLFEAIKTRHFIQARQLIESGVSINCTNKNGATPLIETCRDACENDPSDARITFVRYLVEKECNVSKKDRDGMTAYMYAIETQNKQIGRVLERNQIWASLYKGYNKQRAISINDYLSLYDISELDENSNTDYIKSQESVNK